MDGYVEPWMSTGSQQGDRGGTDEGERAPHLAKNFVPFRVDVKLSI